MFGEQKPIKSIFTKAWKGHFRGHFVWNYLWNSVWNDLLSDISYGILYFRRILKFHRSCPACPENSGKPSVDEECYKFHVVLAHCSFSNSSHSGTRWKISITFWRQVTFTSALVYCAINIQTQAIYFIPHFHYIRLHFTKSPCTKCASDPM